MGGLRERSLWDALRGLWVRFLRVGVWEVPLWGQSGSLWGLLVEDTPLLAFLPTKAGKGLRNWLLLIFCSSVSIPLCHISQQAPWRSAPLIPSTHLLVPLRGPGGSQSQGLSSLCSLLLNSRSHCLSWAPACPLALDKPPVLCSPQRMGPRGHLSSGRKQHKQACACCPCNTDPGPTCGSPDSHGAGLVFLWPGSGPLLEQVSLLRK